MTRPLSILIVIPGAFAAAIAVLIPLALIAWLVPRVAEPVSTATPAAAVFAMMVFVFWARSDKEGRFRLWLRNRP